MKKIKKYIKKQLVNKEKRTLLGNFTSLSILQVVNYILPLITIPYLVRILGAEKYGLIAFAQAFIQYFIVITDYGFNISATREISINRDNKDKISEIYSSVMIIKLFLMFLSLLLISLLVFTINKFKGDMSLYYLTFGWVIGQVLFPQWFFQGMERMKYITIVNVIAKTTFVALIFLCIRTKEQYHLVPLFYSLGFIVSGIAAQYFVLKKFDLHYNPPRWSDIKFQLKEGWHVFLSRIAINIYTATNIFLLGIMTNNTIVGYYSVADKLIRAAKGLLQPLTQALFPFISKKMEFSKLEGLRFVRKILFIVGGCTFCLSLLIFIFARPIVFLLFGHEFGDSIDVLRILAFVPFIVGLSNILGVQTMFALNYKKEVSRVLMMAGFINILLLFVFIPFLKERGVAIAVLITEAFVTVSMYVYLRFKGIDFLSNFSNVVAVEN